MEVGGEHRVGPGLVEPAHGRNGRPIVYRIATAPVRDGATWAGRGERDSSPSATRSGQLPAHESLTKETPGAHPPVREGNRGAIPVRLEATRSPYRAIQRAPIRGRRPGPGPPDRWFPVPAAQDERRQALRACAKGQTTGGTLQGRVRAMSPPLAYSPDPYAKVAARRVTAIHGRPPGVVRAASLSGGAGSQLPVGSCEREAAGGGGPPPLSPSITCARGKRRSGARSAHPANHSDCPNRGEARSGIGTQVGPAIERQGAACRGRPPQTAIKGHAGNILGSPRTRAAWSGPRDEHGP